VRPARAVRRRDPAPARERRRPDGRGRAGQAAARDRRAGGRRHAGAPAGPEGAHRGRAGRPPARAPARAARLRGVRRALQPLLPPEEEFAYTIRCVSDILESNGSSSMASVCGGSLALMEAGVPMRGAVAGVAMGLVKDASKIAVLSDIAGLEDHEGDMDFKVAGTSKGITALQMDIKVTGISREVMAQALQQAKEGRLFILRKMDAASAKPKAEP